MGTNCRAIVRPSQVAELVSSKTNHAIATDCIQVPVSEIAWAIKNLR